MKVKEKKFCPQCKGNDKKSKIFHDGSSRTLMSYEPYWDEDGNYHDNNPNIVTYYYRCSNGHRWGEDYGTNPDS